MKKYQIVLIAILTIGAVLAFTYLAPDFGTQGYIRKKGGDDSEIVRKTYDVTTTERTPRSRVQTSCSDLYYSVDSTLNAIKDTIEKISSNYPKITGTEMSEVTDTYANALNEMDAAISAYNNAYGNYKKNSCQNDTCNNTVQPVYDTAATIYSDYVNLYHLYLEIKENKELWSQKYDFQYKKLENELAQQISTKEKNKIIAQMNTLNTNPEIKDLQKKIQDLDTKRLELEKNIQTSKENSKNSVKNFETHCKK